MLARILFLSLILVFSSARAEEEQPQPGDNLMGENDITAEELLVARDDDFVIGDKSAPITIIEYASLTCPHCASFHNNTYDDLKEKYIDTGKVNFIFRSFPLDEASLRASMMATCAGEEKYGKFLKVLFSTQSNWSQKKNYLEVLANIGKLGGMPSSDFDLCIADKDLEHKIMQDKFYALKQLEVRSTPTFFINGVMHKGSRDLEYFTTEIEKILNPEAEEKAKTE